MATTQQTEQQEHELAVHNMCEGMPTAAANAAKAKVGGMRIKTGLRAGLCDAPDGGECEGRGPGVPRRPPTVR
jgi:hypothetical protein